MRKYIVVEVTKQDTLTIVRLEPQKVPLLFEDEIPSGCIQHIISNISKHGKESEKACNRMCEMLCGIYLNDDSFRKANQNVNIAAPFTADNKDVFRRYKGIEILIEMLKEHNSVTVAKTLTYVLTGNSKHFM